jgi:hypothetical protein
VVGAAPGRHPLVAPAAALLCPAVAQRRGQRSKQRQTPQPARPPEGNAGASQQTPQQQPQTDLHDLVRREIHPRLRALERERGHSVVAYFLGEQTSLADEQIQHLYEHLRRVGKQDQLGLWIHSRGGATETPWKAVSLFREFCGRFSVLIPYRAHSAATLLSLGADEIVMTEMGELGPVDPSRRHPLLPQEEAPNGRKTPIPISVQDLRHVLQFLKREMGEELPPDAAATVYTALFEKVHPLAIGALEQSWALSIQIAERVLSTHMDPEGESEQIKAIVNRLSDHYKSHLYQINRKEAREIGLKVVDASQVETALMWQLYHAYAHLAIAGEGEVDGKKAVVTGIGHIDSAAGSTIGLALAEKAKPAEIVGARWESRWQAPAPDAQPGAPQAAPPPAEEPRHAGGPQRAP